MKLLPLHSRSRRRLTCCLSFHLQGLVLRGWEKGASEQGWGTVPLPLPTLASTTEMTRPCFLLASEIQLISLSVLRLLRSTRFLVLPPSHHTPGNGQGRVLKVHTWANSAGMTATYCGTLGKGLPYLSVGSVPLQALL